MSDTETPTFDFSTFDSALEEEITTAKQRASGAGFTKGSKYDQLVPLVYQFRSREINGEHSPVGYPSIFRALHNIATGDNGEQLKAYFESIDFDLSDLLQETPEAKSRMNSLGNALSKRVANAYPDDERVQPKKIVRKPKADTADADTTTVATQEAAEATPAKKAVGTKTKTSAKSGKAVPDFG